MPPQQGRSLLPQIKDAGANQTAERTSVSLSGFVKEERIHFSEPTGRRDKTWRRSKQLRKNCVEGTLNLECARDKGEPRQVGV